MTIETNRLYDYKLNAEGAEKLKEAKIEFSNFQEKLLGELKPGRNASIVKSKLEEASFYMSRAIAEQADNHDSINTY
jgi:hypothetical protein